MMLFSGASSVSQGQGELLAQVQDVGPGTSPRTPRQGQQEQQIPRMPRPWHFPAGTD